MDILSTYNQVPMAVRDSLKKAFTNKYGLCEFTIMPSTLKNMPATYTQLMELILSVLQWSLCLIYLDDVKVFYGDFDEQVNWLDKVLTQLGSTVLKLKGSKCMLFSTKVSFLGHTL